jgi:hypothetical protein
MWSGVDILMASIKSLLFKLGKAVENRLLKALSDSPMATAIVEKHNSKRSRF